MDEHDAWLEHVLGFRIPQGAPSAGADVLATWRDAKDSVDGRLSVLSARLRATDDPDLERIADFGLFRIGTGEGVALTKALFDYSRAAPAEQAGPGKAVRAAVQKYRAALDTNLVRLIDANPLDVEIGLEATIGGALDAIEQALP